MLHAAKLRRNLIKSSPMKPLRDLLKDSTGATAIEYGLIASLVSVAALAAFLTLGSSNKELYCGVEDAIANAINSNQGPGSSGSAPGHNKC
jgi:pilus assembly protein Flp/PilA